MRFFDIAKKITCGAYTVGLSSAVMHREVSDAAKRVEMRKSHPNARYESDIIAIGGQELPKNERMVDNETSEIVVGFGR